MGARLVRGIWSVGALLASLGCSPLVVDAFAPDPEPPALCPDGGAELTPSVCGCGVPSDDFDGDGTPDCVDRCPDNADRIAPLGDCGCSAFPDTAACQDLRRAIRNLYTFDGSGTIVVDSVGDSNGRLSHTDIAVTPAQLEPLQGNGRLRLDGTGAYVELPTGMISTLTSATFETWLVWRGSEAWSRIFDFGNNGGTPVDGITYLFLTPYNANTQTVRVAFSLAGPLQEDQAEAMVSLSSQSEELGSVPDHVAVVLDASDASMHLYLNGTEVDSIPLSGDLAAISDTNNWLGRSNYATDPAITATYIEFRIYNQALSAAQLFASYQAGPGALD